MKGRYFSEAVAPLSIVVSRCACSTLGLLDSVFRSAIAKQSKLQLTAAPAATTSMPGLRQSAELLRSLRSAGSEAIL